MVAGNAVPGASTSGAPGSPTTPDFFTPAQVVPSFPLTAARPVRAKTLGTFLLLFGVFTVAFSPMALIGLGGGACLIMIFIGAVLWGAAWVLGVGHYMGPVLVGFAVGTFGVLLLFGSLVFSLMIGIFDWGDAATGLVIGVLGLLVIYRYRARLSGLGIGSQRIPRPVALSAAAPTGVGVATAPTPRQDTDRYCGACGAGNSRVAKFCGKCGRSLPELPPPG